MSTNPLRREGGYWKPVLDYEHWDDADASSSYSQTADSARAAEPPVRHDLCRHCGSEFVVDSPYCRMCGRGREEEIPATRSVPWNFHQLRKRLGLSLGASICLILGVLCIVAAIVTSFIYTAGTLVDWQAIQIWRTEWLIGAGVAFLCGILLNGKKKTDKN